MSSVLHPIGPEPAWIYWLRRTMILGVGVILVVSVVAVITKSNGASAVSADPPPGTSPMPTAPATSESESFSPTPAADRTSTASSPSPTQSATSSARSSRTPTWTSLPSAISTKSAAACDGSDLRATLTGKRSVDLKEPVTFDLSVINDGKETCVVTVDSENFELKIYSGSDRIWSTEDCPTSVTPIKTQIAAQQAVEWQMTWNGFRSASDCKQDSESLGAGTYIATAELSDAEPVRLRMILND